MLSGSDSRREFLTKSVYIVPTILSLNVALVEARAASMPPNRGRGRGPHRGPREDRPMRPTRDVER